MVRPVERVGDEVEVDPRLDPARREGSTALWFGPGGTVTPLHHDTSNILFGNVYGAKRLVGRVDHEPLPLNFVDVGAVRVHCTYSKTIA